MRRSRRVKGWKSYDGRREEYLGHGDSAVRRIFTKARTGTVELRLETGRWESLLVAGLMLRRQYRTCRLCKEEVEDCANGSLYARPTV